MKTILKEWKGFVNEAKDYLKTPLEREIETKAAELNMPYNENLADIKASAHAVHFLQGGELSNQSEYLSRFEFGLSGAQRIIAI